MVTMSKQLTVKDLIAELHKYPADMKVFTNDPESAPSYTYTSIYTYGEDIWSLDLVKGEELPEEGEKILIIY